MPRPGYLYILANKKNGTLYVGVTNNLSRRVWQHKQKDIEGFTAEYDIDRLVYYEIHDDISDAITREMQIKKWKMTDYLE